MFALSLVGSLGITLLIRGIGLARMSSLKSRLASALGVAAIGMPWLVAWLRA